MPLWTKILCCYLLAINLITCFAFSLDKRRARREARRLRESTLLTLAALGGAPGGLLGMRVFHHKTLHRKFTLGLPAILIAELTAAILLWQLLH